MLKEYKMGTQNNWKGYRLLVFSLSINEKQLIFLHASYFATRNTFDQATYSYDMWKIVLSIIINPSCSYSTHSSLLLFKILGVAVVFSMSSTSKSTLMVKGRTTLTSSRMRSVSAWGARAPIALIMGIGTLFPNSAIRGWEFRMWECEIPGVNIESNWRSWRELSEGHRTRRILSSANKFLFESARTAAIFFFFVRTILVINRLPDLCLGSRHQHHQSTFDPFYL